MTLCKRAKVHEAIHCVCYGFNPWSPNDLAFMLLIPAPIFPPPLHKPIDFFLVFFVAICNFLCCAPVRNGPPASSFQRPSVLSKGRLSSTQLSGSECAFLHSWHSCVRRDPEERMQILTQGLVQSGF